MVKLFFFNFWFIFQAPSKEPSKISEIAFKTIKKVFKTIFVWSLNALFLSGLGVGVFHGVFTS